MKKRWLRVALSPWPMVVTLGVGLIWPWTVPWNWLPWWAWSFYKLGHDSGFDKGAHFANKIHQDVAEGMMAHFRGIRDVWIEKTAEPEQKEEGH